MTDTAEIVRRLQKRETCRNGGGLCTDKGMAIPGFCTCKEAASLLETLTAERDGWKQDYLDTERERSDWRARAEIAEQVISVLESNDRATAKLLADTGRRMEEAEASRKPLLEFFKWAMREGPWDGGDLDGASIQDKAEALGLIVKTLYDAEKHGVQSDFETGDDWFEFAPSLRAADVGTPKDNEADV